MGHNTELTVLKIKEGQFVTVQGPNDKLHLCAVHFQTIKQNVHIEERVVKDKYQMAFQFSHTNNNYILKVDGKELMMEKKTDCDTLTDNHWFEKLNLHSGAYYGLRSVAEPSQYLSKFDNGQKTIFCLRATSADCAELIDDRTV